MRALITALLALLKRFNYDVATFDATAATFDNADAVAFENVTRANAAYAVAVAFT